MKHLALTLGVSLSILSGTASAFWNFNPNPCQRHLKGTYTFDSTGWFHPGDVSPGTPKAGEALGDAISGMIYFNGYGDLQAAFADKNTDEESGNDNLLPGEYELDGCIGMIMITAEPDLSTWRIFVHPDGTRFVFTTVGPQYFTFSGSAYKASDDNLIPDSYPSDPD